MPEGAAFRRWAEAIRAEIEVELDRVLPASEHRPQTLHRALRHAVFAGGKRVRPLLTVLAGEGAGGDRMVCLQAGACLELIHTYSLVHDDLPALDDDDLRRGRPTVHREFDEATAVLAGDSLLTLGLTGLAHLGGADSLLGARAVRLVGEAIGTGGMIGGQMEDLEAEKRWPENPEEALDRIHRLKTGALLTASLRLGGLCAEVAAPADELLRRMGECIGLLFQIGDDILDVEGTSEVLGKTAGKDAASEKLTFPGLYGLDESKRKLQRVREEATVLADRMPQSDLWHSLLHYLTLRQA